MSKKRATGKKGSALSEEVQALIIRKLRHRQREQQKVLVSANQTAYSKLHKEMLANIRVGGIRAAVTSVPLASYKEMVASAAAMTQEWPGAVWEAIASTLATAQVVSHDGAALNKIVDEFAWAVGQNPFTLNYVDPERFIGMVRRNAGRYGVNRQDDLTAFRSQMDLAAAAARVGILNTARHAREGIAVAVDEYVLSSNTPVLQLKASTKKHGRSPNGKGTGTGLEVGSREWREQNARKAANAKHDKPGGSRDKQRRIRTIWADGHYSTRDICAEQECGALGMSFSAARKALRNTPDR